MLRCPCEILNSFRKKKSFLFSNSVFNLQSNGYSFHQQKYFFHMKKFKQNSKVDCDLKHCILFRNPIKFISTSTFLFKDENNNDNNSKIIHKVKDISKAEKINQTKDSVSFENNVAKSKNESSIKDNTVSEHSKKNMSSINSKNIHENKKILVEKKEASKDNSQTYKKEQLITPDQYIKEKIISNENKIKEPPSLDQKISDIESKSVEILAKKKNVVEGPKKNEIKIPTNVLESDVKRQVHKINLGSIVSADKLEPPDEANSEKEKHVSELRFLKQSTQKLILDKAKSILKKTAALKSEDDTRNIKILNLGPVKGDVNLNVNSRRRQIVDLNKCSTERNFITPVRAMTDFLLKPSDLEGLRKTKRRSPYENEPPITVYWRKDVEAKALDVWGTKENLLKEILKRDIERRRYQQNLFTVKRKLRDYRREQGRESEIKSEKNGPFGASGRVVLTAIAINGTNFLFKILAWLYTGSHSMFSEAIHSLADTINQLILIYGIHKSVQRADSDHPYGYTNMRYVSSLISGVGIFCVGSGLSLYHGVTGLTHPSDFLSFYWAYFILVGSLVSEGATLLVAFNSIRIGAKNSDMSFSEYVLRGHDPSVNVVLLEDFAAVIGVAIAGFCMGLSSYLQSPIPDAIGSLFVGGLLGGVASFIIYTNVAALVGRSIPQERLDKINAELESDVMIRAIHDVKGIDIGNSLVRYKAEMDFDGGELTRSYLDKQDLNQLLEEVKKMQTIDELEEFMLKHGENIVDMMGGEIDRIELKLRKKHPEIRHCDLEIL